MTPKSQVKTIEQELAQPDVRTGMMTAAVLHGREDVRIERVPVPRIAEDEVLVRVNVALTDGTDFKASSWTSTPISSSPICSSDSCR